MTSFVNPYIAGNPVTNPQMFFGREDIFAFIRQTLIGKYRNNMVILYGQQRSGKTSILYQMRSRMGSDYLCVLIDLEVFTIAGSGGFLWELARHTMRILQRDYKIKLSPLSYESFTKDPFESFEREFLDQLWPILGERHLLLMLDEVVRIEERIRDGKLDRDIFAYLRSLMQHHEQLDCILSLGSTIEGLKQECSNLFNLGLCKNISFLSIDATTDLITRPVSEYYHVEPAAIERIRGLTSGHPYYTQLLCHCLFNYWRQEQPPVVTVQDVDTILDEVVERGMAVLKHKWDESTLGEKAVLVAMATAMEEQIHGVSPEEIAAIWRRHTISIPSRAMVQAWQNLLQRELVTTPGIFAQQCSPDTSNTPKMQSSYIFTVDLLRQWLQKYQRIEWVREEIIQNEPGWLYKPINRRVVIGGIITAGALLVAGAYNGITWFTAQKQSGTPILYKPFEPAIQYLEHSAPIWSITWSPRPGKHIASASEDHTIHVWNAYNGKRENTYAKHSEAVTHVIWSPDHKYIASCGNDNTVRVWDALEGCHDYTYVRHQNDRGPSNAVFTAAWRSDSRYIASGGYGQVIHVWEAQPENIYKSINHRIYEGHEGTIISIAWSPDDKYIASVSKEDRQLHIWNPGTNETLFTHPLQNDPGRVSWIDKNHIIFIDRYAGVQEWNIQEKKLTQTVPGTSTRYKNIALSNDNKHFAAVSGNTAQICNIYYKEDTQQYPHHKQELLAIAWSPHEKLIASAGKDNMVHVWPYEPWLQKSELSQ